MTTRVVSRCRVCDSPDLYRYLDLGDQPFANALLAHPNDDEVRAPLTLQACPHCTLSQLTHVVDPATLFRGAYPYASGVSRGWHEHCEHLAAITDGSGHPAIGLLEPGSLVVDIGSNDGTMLSKFAAQGHEVLGIEPADFTDYNVLHEFWSADLARDLDLHADVILASNVLGHVNDVHDFAEGLRLALRPKGRAVIEVPYLPYLLSSLAFDTVYHEHLSYWTVTALATLLHAHGLRISRLAFLPALHGGSLQATVIHGMPGTHGFAGNTESHLHDPTTYDTFESQVHGVCATIRDALASRTPLYGFGAAAKATVLLNTLGLDHLECIYDDTPAKQGRFLPGVHTPIRAPHDLSEHQELVILAWNWVDAIKDRAETFGFGGRFYVPLPRPHWT